MAEFNQTIWFAVGLIILIIFGIIGNTSPTGISNIQFQFDKMNCPFPLWEGIDHLTIDGELAFGMNITHSSTPNNPDPENDLGTAYRCEFDPTIDETSFYTSTYTFGATCFSVIPCGWFSFASETLTKVAEKITAFFTLLAFFLTPINFNILGFTLADIGGVGLMLVIAIYGFAYIGIVLYLGGFIIGIIGRFT